MYRSDGEGATSLAANCRHGREWQVSTSGGTRPLWAGNGRELFYATQLLQLINPRHLVELIEGVMAPDPERLALNLEIPAILQRSLAKIAERREFTLAVRAL